MASRSVLILIVTVSFSLAACGGQNAPHTTAVVLFDVSGSTDVPAIRQQYLKDFEKVLAVTAGGGVLVADIVDDNPLAHSTFPVNEPFRPFNSLTENRLGHERRVRRQREAVMESARQIVEGRRSPRPGTHVLEAIQLAERVFETFPADRRVLVVFSDMIEQSRRYDFLGVNLSEQGIRRIIAEERDSGRLPNLAGVEVCVTGAGAAVEGGLRPERIEAIRDFWLEYFKATGANLPKARYGATLIKCP